MEEKPFYKKWWFVLLAVIVVINIGSGLSRLVFGDDDEVEAEEPEIEEVVEAEETSRRTEEDVQDDLDELGEEIFEENYRKTSFLWEIEGREYYDDGSIDPNNSLIENVNVEVFLTSSQIGNFLMNVEDYLEDIQDMEYAQVQIAGYGMFTDKYGDEDEQNATTIVLTKETIDKINFDNFDWRNLPDIADEFWMHQTMETKGL